MAQNRRLRTIIAPSSFLLSYLCEGKYIVLWCCRFLLVVCWLLSSEITSAGASRRWLDKDQPWWAKICPYECCPPLCPAPSKPESSKAQGGYLHIKSSSVNLAPDLYCKKRPCSLFLSPPPSSRYPSASSYWHWQSCGLRADSADRLTYLAANCSFICIFMYEQWAVLGFY